MKSENFDVIVIGSGMGGLTAASLCAQLVGKRVLVLERHFKLGGFTHTFNRVGREWDVGVHYVGEMAPGAMPRAFFDLVTGGEIKWNALPDPIEKFVYPGFTFDVPVGESRYKKALVNRFPAEANALDGYFADVKRVARWSGLFFMGGMMPSVLRFFSNRLDGDTKRLALSPTADVLRRRFKNPELIALLCSQWGDYGLPPSRSAFLIHAVIVNHYLEGAYYPACGAGVIAKSVRPLVERSGGTLLVNHEVTAIIVEKGRARGVRAVERRGTKTLEKEFLAATVISNAGATTTYSRLLSHAYAADALRDLNSLPSPTAHVSLYVGFKDDPGKLGFHGENHWIYNSLDHEEIFRRRNELLEGRPMACFLSFPSMKGGAGGHTAEIISYLDYEPFRLWRDKPWKHRGDDYENLKERISRALIDFVDQRYPGFSALVDFHELSTPLTTEYFTGHPHGAAYGLPAVPERFQMRWAGPRTPVKGLYLAGADAACVGVVGAMMGGVSAAGLAMGWRGLWRLFHAVGKRVKPAAAGFRGQRG